MRKPRRRLVSFKMGEELGVEDGVHFFDGFEFDDHFVFHE